MAISIPERPAFLPHHIQVSIETPCGAGCGSEDRFWMPPIPIGETNNISTQARRIEATSCALRTPSVEWHGSVSPGLVREQFNPAIDVAAACPAPAHGRGPVVMANGAESRQLTVATTSSICSDSALGVGNRMAGSNRFYGFQTQQIVALYRYLGHPWRVVLVKQPRPSPRPSLKHSLGGVGSRH